MALKIAIVPLEDKTVFSKGTSRFLCGRCLENLEKLNLVLKVDVIEMVVMI